MAQSWSPPALPAETILANRQAAREGVFQHTRYIRTGAVEALAGPDLRVIFELYDSLFFHDQLRRSLDSSGCHIYFEVSSRMTSAGANIGVRGAGTSRPQYRLAVSAPVLYGSFRNEGETGLVNGIECSDRLFSLLILMEHELVHLYEMLSRGKSGHGASFQAIARHLFGHTDYRHALMSSRRQADLIHGLRTGDRVSFSFEGRRLVGRISRISRRATVLVPLGRQLFKFYVPLDFLTKVPDGAG